MEILIADDSQLSRHLVEATLVKRGYRTIAVADGIAALNVLQRPAAPPLAILDVNMPGLDGTEVCRRVRQAAQALSTYIILLTANSSKADLVAALNGGADDYVIKPFDGEELCARVQVGVRIVELQRRLAEHVHVLEDTSAQLLRRSRQAGLGADVGAVLTVSDRLPRILQRCAELIVQRLEVGLARIWTLNPEGDALEMQASAGVISRLDDEYGRIALGQLKVGFIAQERQSYLTNQLSTDPHSNDREWALREGLESFAGYPLIVEDQLVGVLALFARESFPEDTQETLAALSHTIAQGIERKRAEEALRRSEEKYRTLVANIPDVTWTSDSQGRISFISPNIEGVSNFTVAEVYRDPQHRFNRIHPDDLPAVKEAYDSLFSRNATFEVNYRFQRKDGEWLWLHDRAVATYEKDGVMYADGVFSDITERRRFEEALRVSEEHLRRAQKLESIGQLAAGIAHEINTPMQYLGDNLRFIQDSFGELDSVLETSSRLLAACQAEGVLPELTNETSAFVAAVDVEYLTEEIPKALQQSLEGVEHVSKIVRSMKDFAHPSFNKTAADLNKAIEGTITVARNEWKYVADLVTDFDPTLPLVPCVVSEINQVVLNMVINAAHAIADVVGDGSRGKGTIAVSTRHNARWAEIQISDTGTGIPEKVRERIFDPFFTTKEVGRGTGQGLAISHAVVEKHQGTIEVETEMGHGTTFIIRLPLQESSASVVAAAQMGAFV
jgi:PAS domain S-box-containing protein